MNRDEALNTVGYVLGKVEETLRSDQYGYDEQLIIEIGEACKRWEDRQGDLEKPWSVRLFDGNTNSWSVVKSGMNQKESYRAWYDFTYMGTINKDSRSENYYFICPEDEELSGRHRYDEDDGDFSYRYLLDKSFG